MKNDKVTKKVRFYNRRSGAAVWNLGEIGLMLLPYFQGRSLSSVLTRHITHFQCHSSAADEGLFNEGPYKRSGLWAGHPEFAVF